MPKRKPKPDDVRPERFCGTAGDWVAHPGQGKAVYSEKNITTELVLFEIRKLLIGTEGAILAKQRKEGRNWSGPAIGERVVNPPEGPVTREEFEQFRKEVGNLATMVVSPERFALARSVTREEFETLRKEFADLNKAVNSLTEELRFLKKDVIQQAKQAEALRKKTPG
jgi:hypothetical protein